MIGDHGGIKAPGPQNAVSYAMQGASGSRRAFVYSVDDVVYFNGDPSEQRSTSYSREPPRFSRSQQRGGLRCDDQSVRQDPPRRSDRITQRVLGRLSEIAGADRDERFHRRPRWAPYEH